MIISSLRVVIEASTIGGCTMSRRSHIIILNRMRNTSSVILVLLRCSSVHLRIIIILLSACPSHHLIVIHWVLILPIPSTAHVRRRVLLMLLLLLISEAHWCRSRHAIPSILLLLLLLSMPGSSTRVSWLLWEPAAACWHQRWIHGTSTIAVLRLKNKLLSHIFKKTSLLSLFSEPFSGLNLILFLLCILISALACPHRHVIHNN